MIIGIDISSIPYGTGVSEYTKQLILHLLKIDQKNTYKLFFGHLRQKLPTDFLKNISRYPNCKIYSYPLPPKIANFLWNKLRILPIELFIGKCDVFHTSDWTQPPTLTAKTVSTIHDLTPFLYPNWHSQETINAHTLKMRYAIKNHSAFISVSLNTQRDLEKLFQQNSIVIYEATDENYKPLASPQGNYFLAQGTREPRKNLDKIISAFLSFKKRFPKSEYKLKIAGKYGWGKDVKPNSEIEILGYVTNQELLKLHQNAKVLVYPSLYEGFGLPILKSFACGIPVITSNTSSLPEIAQDAAILVNPNSTVDISKAMEKIIKKDVWTNLANKTLKIANQFSWTQTAKNTLNFYLSLC